MRVPRRNAVLVRGGGRSERAREKKGGGGREKIGVEQVIWGKHENVKRLRELRQVADKNTQG